LDLDNYSFIYLNFALSQAFIQVFIPSILYSQKKQ